MFLKVAVLLGLLAGVADAAKSTPHVKWGQTKEQLFVSFLVRDLEPTSVKLDLTTVGDISFSAKNTKGETVAVDLPLREDVKTESSNWKVEKRPDKWGTAVLLVLDKVHQHRWDLLVTEPKKFKGIVDKDWSREDQNLEPDEELPYLEENSDWITDLTTKNLNKTIEKFSAVIVNVRYPWCSQCKSQDETFAKAAKAAKLKGKKDKAWKKVGFALVDAREQRSLARQLRATCDYTCNYQIFSEKGEEPVTMKSKWSDTELLAEVQKYLSPAVAVVKEQQEVEEFKAKNTTCVGGFASEASPAYGRFKRVAGMMRGQLVFAATFGAEKAIEMWPHKQNFSFKFEGAAQDNGTELLAWIKPRAIPLLQPYDWQMRETYEALGLPLAKLWIDDADANPSLDKTIRHIVRRVAKKFIGRIAVVEQKKSTYSYELRDYGLNRPEVFPAFGIASNASYNAVKYGFEVTSEVAASAQEFWKDADKAVPKLTEFVEKVLAGEWPEAHESDAPQTNWTKGSIKKLVWKSYDEIRAPEKPLLLVVYGKYRAEAERKSTEEANLAEAMTAYADTFTVASYDTSENYLPSGDFKRDKYTSDTEWYWVVKGEAMKKLMKPKKDAPIKNVVEFAKKQSGLDIDVEAAMTRFDTIMTEKPPPTTTTFAPPKMPDMGAMGDMGGMGGMPGMGDMGGMGGMPGMGDMSDLMSKMGGAGGLGAGMGTGKGGEL